MFPSQKHLFLMGCIPFRFLVNVKWISQLLSPFCSIASVSLADLKLINKKTSNALKPVQTFLSCLKEKWKTLKEFVKKIIFYLNIKDFRNKCNILFCIVTQKKLLTGQRFLFHIFIDSPIKRKNQSVWCTLTTFFIECAQYFSWNIEEK